MKAAKRAASVFSAALTILALIIVVAGSTQTAELNDPILARVADALAGYSVAKPPPQLRGAEDLYRSQLQAVAVIINTGSLGSGIVLTNSLRAAVLNRAIPCSHCP
jgi:hypothetical protein